jgi:hypothetical protein
MSHAKELFKQALLGGNIPNRNFSSHIGAMAEECAQSIAIDPNKRPEQVVADKVIQAGLNRDQTARLVERTNHAIMKPVLKSSNKSERKKIINKKEVTDLLENRKRTDDTGFSLKGEGGLEPARYAGEKKYQKGEVTKTASINKFAEAIHHPDFSDYLQEPASLGMRPLDKWEPEPEPVSLTKIAKERSYREAAIEHFDGQIGNIEMEYEGLAGNFAKLASQYVLEGTPFIDVIKGSIQFKPDKSTVELLKMSALKCEERGLMLKKEAAQWIDALEIVKNSGNPAMDKTARLGLPVADSLINEDIKGRVRILNGDSYLVKMLNRVGDAEKRLRKMRLARQSLFNEPEANYARTVVDFSENN